jgi:hypothetical protein
MSSIAEGQRTAIMQPVGKASWYRSAVIWTLSALTVASVSVVVAISIGGFRDSPINRVSDLLRVIVPLATAALGLLRLRLLHMRESAHLMRMQIAFCAAAFLTSAAEAIWTSYVLSGNALPYPSAADFFNIASYVAWIMGLGLLYWGLGTTIREELGPFLGVFTSTCAAIFSIFLLIGITLPTVGSLPKLMLDVVDPVMVAFLCALLGSLVCGPQLQRLSPPWRWYVGVLYAGWLLQLFAEIAFAIGTTRVGGAAASFDLSYYAGGPIDTVFLAAYLLMLWAVALTPFQATLTADREIELDDNHPATPGSATAAG